MWVLPSTMLVMARRLLCKQASCCPCCQQWCWPHDSDAVLTMGAAQLYQRNADQQRVLAVQVCLLQWLL